LSFQGLPEPGAPVSITVGNIVSAAEVWLVAGISATASPYGALPLALPHPPFDNGCSLLTSAELLIQLPFTGSSVTVGGTLPPSLTPYHLYVQAAVIGTPGHPARVSLGLDIHAVPPMTGISQLSGSIVHQAGSVPAPNARVTLYKPDLSFFLEARTAGTGTFSFANVPAGGYLLGAALPGSDYAETSVSLAPGTNQASLSLVPESHPGSWSVIGDTLPEMLDATDIGALRPDGTILYCHDTSDPIVFDPVTGTKAFPPSSGSAQGCMNGTLLEDGSVILVGGQAGSSPGSFMNAISWVKRFKPDNTWEILGNMLAPTGRWYPGLARLNDGRLLVYGGGTAPLAVRTDTCEVFNPLTSTWTWTGTMGSVNEFAPGALLGNGLVLRTWGAAPEVYNPSTGQWAPTGPFTAPARGYPDHSDHSLLVLSDSRAVAVGVRRALQPAAPMTEYYQPATGTWTAGTSPSLVRMQGEVVYMPDGKVFFGAGDKETTAGPEPNVLGIVKRCDLLDPISASWRTVAPMLAFREYHAVTLLVPDGRVVMTGGTQIKFQYGPTTANIEAWSPPYLFRGVRPVISNLSDQSPARGQTVSFGVFPATTLTSVVLMGLQSTTHWVDGGIPRRLELAVVQNGGQTQVTLPTNADALPLGWYMLFAMVDDIPSKALMLRVDP
jgi:hypothetical protein